MTIITTATITPTEAGRDKPPSKEFGFEADEEDVEGVTVLEGSVATAVSEGPAGMDVEFGALGTTGEKALAAELVRMNASTVI